MLARLLAEWRRISVSLEKILEPSTRCSAGSRRAKPDWVGS